MKRKSVLCVFAHPDDEAFGPAGTIYKFSKTHDVYLICATKGQNGINSHAANSAKLSKIRENELKESAKVLCVKQIYFLGFKDGTLCNNSYHKLADKIRHYIKKFQPNIIITYEPHGVSGHIDHIVVSYATQFVLRDYNKTKELWMYCLKKGREEFRKDYFIYFPMGYTSDEINKTNDVSGVWEIKVKAMMAHKSQVHDAEKILKVTSKFPKEEYFIIKKL